VESKIRIGAKSEVEAKWRESSATMDALGMHVMAPVAVSAIIICHARRGFKRRDLKRRDFKGTDFKGKALPFQGEAFGGEAFGGLEYLSRRQI
jgi:hypothetical protein